MTERAFSYGVIAVTIHRATVRDRIARDTISARLHLLELGDAASRYLFSTLAAQSVVDGMAWVNAQSSDAELAAAFEAWLSLDGALYDRWTLELDLINAPLNDPALLPPEQMADAEKKGKRRSA